ncbi:hypothetical protein Tco_1091240 [Tanacetum coccineum]|uniref:Transmembrane protein n=1 Tax=Tanacetum coccineum TaxID=301880 RepID=A0ABQ5I8U2_9ASTR
MRSIISTVSISLKDFLAFHLLLMVIIVAVVIVTVIWVVIFVNVIVGVIIVVAIIGVVVVVGGVPSIIDLSFVIIGWHEHSQDMASSVKVLVANFTYFPSTSGLPLADGSSLWAPPSTTVVRSANHAGIASKVRLVFSMLTTLWLCNSINIREHVLDFEVGRKRKIRCNCISAAADPIST